MPKISLSVYGTLQSSILVRWRDPLIGTWHNPVQILNMGKRGQYFCFFHRMLQERASSQNDSCDRLTCEFLSALTVVTRKLYWMHREKKKKKEIRKQSLTSKIKKLFLSPPWTITRRADLVSTWRQLKKLTREAKGLLLSIRQDFIRDCFWPFKPTPL